MGALFHTTNFVIKYFFRTILRVDSTQLSKVPAVGPLIIAGNHVNALDAPVIFTHLQPRPCSALAKIESWDNPFFHWLFDLWEVIPIRRGEADREAFRLAVEALGQGKLLAVAPEGTRSHDGQLQRGYPGIVLLAIRSKAPVQPVVYYGAEHFWTEIKRLRRAPFKIVVGNPFLLNDRGQGLSKDVRQQMTDEIMYQMAALLPPQYRGVYADLSQATQTYLDFPEGSQSNLTA